jgi:phytoene dehydrogenase-like protein
LTERYDSVVIGGGHNGLVCAAYLARAGQRVLVLEAAATVGGAARSETIVPGFRVSACAHLLYGLHPRVIRELELRKHGLDYAAADIATCVLGRDGAVLRLKGEAASGNVSPEDQIALPALRRRLLKMARALRPMLLMQPPRLANRDFRQTLDLAKLGLAIRGMGQDDMRDFLRIATMNVFDLVQDNFNSPLLQAAFAADAVLGTNMGPRSPGTVLTLLYRLIGEVGPIQAAAALPKGGMGAVTQALARAALHHGATIRTEARVRRILVEDDRATGVELENGEAIAARSIISNADPKTTMLTLIGARHLDAGFQRDIGKIRGKGNAAKLNLALSGRPDFRGLTDADLGGRILLADSPAGIEAQFDPSKYGAWSPHPLMEITLPSVTDPDLAQNGGHVLSAVVQYAPYALKGGWDAQKPHYLEVLLDRLESVAPGIRGLVLGHQLLTPLDLERDYGLPNGHWHHGELAIDQLMMLRPINGAARYAMPVAGVYLCGAGCHPGGGVTGAAGHNAAQAVLTGIKAKRQAA